MEILAIIPARKGSKRLPNKNMLKIGGKTLIEHAIEQALNSRCIDDVVVSTDYKLNDDRVIIHKRPTHLCGDDVSSQTVIDDVLLNYNFDIGVLLQPTSLFRTTKLIDECIDDFLYEGCDSLYTVREFKPHVFYPNGCVYVFKDKLFGRNVRLHVERDDIKSLDIDTQLDYDYAKMIWEKNNK